jgi:hypothetical protein
MATFHFNFRQGESYTVDEQGCPFASAEEAYLGAFAAAQDIWHELLVNRQDPMLCAFEVTDDDGRNLFVLPFSEILDVCQGRSASPRPFRPPSSAVIQALQNRRQAMQTSHEVAQSIRQARAALRETWDLVAMVEKMAGF